MALTATLPPQRRSRIAAAVHHLLTMSMSTTLSRKTPVPSPEAAALRANRAAARIQLDEIAQHAGIKAADLYMFETGRGDISADDYHRACVAVQEIADRAAAQAGEPHCPDHDEAHAAPASLGAGLQRQEDAQPQPQPQQEQEQETDDADDAALPEGQRLRAMREATGVSRIRVARRTGIPSGALAAHEASARPLPPGEFERISKAIAALAAIANSRTPKVGEGTDVDADDDAEAEAPSVASGGHPPAELPTVGENHELKARSWLWWGRVQKGLSLEEFAKMLGIHWKALDALERGTRVMRADQVEEAAALLGVSLDTALGAPDAESVLDCEPEALEEALSRWKEPAADGAAYAPSAPVTEHMRERQKQHDRAVRSHRLSAARKRMGFDQTAGAFRMGFTSSTQLSLLETGARPVNIQHIVAASRAYGVTADWLLGLNDEFEKASQEERITSALGEFMRKLAREAAGALVRHDKLLGGPSCATVRELVLRGQAVLDAMERLDRDSFDEVKGGATLERVAGEFATVLFRTKKAVLMHEAANERMFAQIEQADVVGASAAQLDLGGKNGQAQSA
ncbi:helix-turn-helix transcriptional regulator [Xenophilus azovorans]|uniref:helix-turn-helix transcriptional regulator n=1 Tax=Xenophilus azovorans TaxID=151755 RepID=UPI000570E1BA|nr:helix-turn-helix transcriptional regulator [Xenophilus azovorans]